MLYRLVLADWTIEHVALPGIGGSARQRTFAEPDRFGRNQNAFRIHPVQDVLEAAPLLAQTVFYGNLEILDEELIGIHGLAAHLVDFPRRDAATIEIGVEQGEPMRRAFDLFERRRAGKQQNFFGDLRGRYPDFLTVDNVFVT